MPKFTQHTVVDKTNGNHYTVDDLEELASKLNLIGDDNSLVFRGPPIAVRVKPTAVFEKPAKAKKRASATTKQTATGSVTTISGDVPRKADGTPRKKPGRKPKAKSILRPVAEMLDTPNGTAA